MKIVVDKDIPFIDGVFEPYADVRYIAGAAIGCGDVADADALVVRTRTRCDAQLLSGSKVKVVSTATIGTDHINIEWCAVEGIAVASAAGCNARAVAQWVFAALREIGVRSGTVGVVGVGNVGSEVCAMGSGLGFELLRCDPPRAARGEVGFVSLDEILERSDVVTLHVPLLETTRSMVDARFLEQMRRGAILLNSSRGEVMDEAALLNAAGSLRYAIDVWQGEPLINLDLLSRAAIATPHIAGYSARGKARGTQMAVRAVAETLGIKHLLDWTPKGDFSLENPDNFDIMAIDSALRAAPTNFEALRTIREN